MPSAPGNRILRRSAPIGVEGYRAPKLTPDKTRMLTLARALAAVAGWNWTVRDKAGAEAGAGEAAEAASRISGPIITRVITQCAQHG